ncbi:MAG TPA: hypothetical protein VF748_14825 [Candidatus Acidoferrum sp.]
MDSLSTDATNGSERHVQMPDELERLEARIEKRLDRMDDDSRDWRTRMEAIGDNRHADNIERFEKLETAFNQGVGALAAVRAAWLALIALAGLVIGYLGHKFGGS